ncbi:MAG: hypothetical protein HGN29_12640 [Asgard group archaeon]|nr:hypothetical protein [Asgard group archaeon]
MYRILRKLSILLVLISLLILPSTLSFQSKQHIDRSSNYHKKSLESIEFQNSLPLLNLIPQNPIFIDSDEDFVHYNFPGNGSEDEPYIIENFVINSTIKDYGIIIKSTSKFFAIRNCFIGKCFEACIKIDNVKAGTASIINNICKGFFMIDNLTSQNHGIFVNNSPNSTLIQNRCNSNSRYGIYVLSSPNSTINECFTDNDDLGGILLEESNNSIIKNSISGKGIKVERSISCLIINNTCTEYGYGIQISNSDFCELLNNIIMKTYDFGIRLSKARFSKIRNNICNRSGSGIYLADSENTTIEENYLLNGVHGVVIQESMNTTILDNRFRSSGINFEKSTKEVFETTELDNNSVEVSEDGIWKNKEIVLIKNMENQIFPESDYGQIILFNCSKVYIKNFEFSSYGLFELEFFLCKNIDFTGNIVKGKIKLDNVTESRINSNTINKLKIENCYNIIIEANKILRTELYKSARITVQNNSDISESQENEAFTWLFISNCQELNITSNTCQKVDCAIFARHSLSLNIRNNSFSENYGRKGFIDDKLYFEWFLFGGSIELFNCTKTLVEDNNLSRGNKGVSLFLCYDFHLRNNFVEDYGKGVHLYHSETNYITDNQFLKNRMSIDVDRSDFTQISNNTFSENSYGMYLHDSDSNVIIHNKILRNEYGIALMEECCNNLIQYNIIEENELGIYLHTETKENIIHHNYFINNTQQAEDDSGKNIWYEESTEEGNYWSDHNKKKPYEIAGDGEAVDPYPLNEYFERITRVNYSMNVFSFFILISIILRRRRTKKRKKNNMIVRDRNFH